MLHAQYNNNIYVFYVTTQDAQSYGSNLGFLFKFTNDMSGAVKWGYGQDVDVNARYTKLSIYSTQGGLVDESVLWGYVDLEPNGYWKYEIYMADYSNTACGAPNPTEFGTWQCTNLDSTVIDSGNMDVDVYEIKSLVADTYTITEYDTCNPPPTAVVGTAISQVITEKVCYQEGDVPRYLHFTRVERHPTTNSFYIDSVAEVGSEIRVWNPIMTYVHTITTQPESFVMNIYCQSPIGFFVELWRGGNLIDTYNQFHPLSSVVYPDIQRILCSNNQYKQGVEQCPSTFPYTGSIFFAWNGGWNSVGADVYTEAIEIGKLLVSEQLGEEQVQYTENESPSDTNYIYND
tara:strand:+ start:205 stop:1242 length:1038 start_codon:yes stop_codon:yes gene_type:complete